MARKGGRGASGRLPPYLTYATWQRLLESLRKHTPSQLDRSYFNELGFAMSTILTARSTLFFLGLTNSNNEPTEPLLRLVHSEGENRKEVLREIIQAAYQPILTGIDLEHVTSGQMLRRFQECGAEGDIVRKCLSFFLALAKDAEITLSPSLLSKSRVGAPRKTDLRLRLSRKSSGDTAVAKRETAKKTWWKLLLDKFPALDPSWSAEVKLKWFDDFQELVKRIPSE